MLHGRYGDYIHTPKGNYQLPKGMSAEMITEAQVKEIMAKTEPIIPGKHTFRRKSAK